MLVLLWFMVLCFTVGARKQYEVSYDESPDSHWSPPTTKLPEEYLSSTPEYIPVDHSEFQPDEYEDHRHSEQPSHDYEQKYSMQVGSIRGIPGITFPDYEDIPLTHFSCSDKMYVPGFYADMETGCQVFHVCWPHRRESFLCPVGTIFNQAILACDYWYSSNCSLAMHYYDVNSVSQHAESDYKEEVSMGSMINSLLEAGKGESMSEATEVKSGSVSKVDLSEIVKFLPVKAKVVVYPETSASSPRIIAVASVGKGIKPRVEQAKQRTQIYEETEPENIPEVTSESYLKIVAEASVGKGIKPRVEQVKPKTQIYEIEPKNIPEQPKSTVAPYKPHQEGDNVYEVSTEKPKHIHETVDPSIQILIDYVLEFLEIIEREIKDWTLKRKHLHGEVDPTIQKIIDNLLDFMEKIERDIRDLTLKQDFHKTKQKLESKRHQPKSTAAPYKPRQKIDNVYEVATEKPKQLHREVDPAIEGMTGKVFEHLEKIAREIKDLTLKSNLHKIEQPPESKRHQTKPHLPITRLKQKFITKPVDVPKQQKHLYSRRQTKIGHLPARKHMVSDFVSHRTDASPSTKKALIENYLKRIKQSG